MSRQQAVSVDLCVNIHGKTVKVANNYPCFYPDQEICWEEEPHSDHPKYDEEYSEWGRRHYGDEWYQWRQQMLDKRNIYVQRDNEYIKEQEKLRDLENAVDGRLIIGGMEGADWKSIWRQVKSQNLTESTSKQAGGDQESLYAQGLEQLEDNRQALEWTDEEYEYNKYLMKTRLAANERSRHEDEIGNHQFRLEREVLFTEEDELKASTLPRKSVAYGRLFAAYDRKSDRFKKLRSGIPKNSADNDFFRGNAAAELLERAEDELLEKGPKTERELMKKLEHWQKYGLTIDEHDCLTKLYGFDTLRRPDYAADDGKYNGYDYISLCKRTPTARPLPTESEFESLAKTWEEGLTLNRREIAELRSMYGYSSPAQDTTSPRQRSQSPTKSLPRRSTRTPKSSKPRSRSASPEVIQPPKHIRTVDCLGSSRPKHRVTKSPKPLAQKPNIIRRSSRLTTHFQ